MVQQNTSHKREPKTITNKTPEIQHKLVSDSFLFHLGINIKRYKDDPYKIVEDINSILSHGDEGNHLVGLINPNRQNLIVECYILYGNTAFFVKNLGQKDINDITERIIYDIQNSDVSRCTLDHFQNVLSYLTKSDAKPIVDAINDKMSEIPDTRSQSQINFGHFSAATT